MMSPRHWKRFGVFACFVYYSGWVFAAPVDPEKSLMVTDLTVVEDPTRADSASPTTSVWTFRRLIENMAGVNDPSEFVLRWLRLWETDQSVNGFTVAARPSIATLVTEPWLAKSAANGAPPGTLDLSLAPFRLLAIVNRMDLRTTDPDTGVTDAGESRFVFGVVDELGQPLQFTVIFEYGLPGDLNDWAAKWRNLSNFPFGPEYNLELQALTDVFSSANAVPSKPNGSAINQIRTNEIALVDPIVDPWEMREFAINATSGFLEPRPTFRTPDASLNNSSFLADFINANEAAILAGTHDVPLELNGIPVRAGSALVDFVWNAFGIANSQARHKFALETCSGCHRDETGTAFLHVANRDQGQAAALSDFLTGAGDGVADPVTGEVRNFNELQRRNTDLSQLTKVFRIKTDFNGDGKSDIMWRDNLTGSNVLWFMNSFTRTVASTTAELADGDWKVAGIADFDGDAKADILWRHAVTGENSIWIMDGLTQVVASPISTVADTNWVVVGTDDFDGDAKADIMWHNTVTGQNYLWLMDGVAAKEDGPLSTTSDTDWEIAGVGDFNGDDRADVLWRHALSGDNAMWLMDGFTLSSQTVIDKVSDTNWEIADVDDFNGDGKFDVIWRNVTTGANAMWLMDGPSRIASSTLRTVSDVNWVMADLGDYNGDGRSDVLWRNATTGDNAMWLLDGTTELASSLIDRVFADDWVLVSN